MTMVASRLARHAVVLALDTMRVGDTVLVPRLDRLAKFVPDALARKKLHGKQPKRSDGQQRELCRMHATATFSISDLAKLFSVSRPTVYHTLTITHSIVAIPFSVRSCPLPESTRTPLDEEGISIRWESGRCARLGRRSDPHHGTCGRQRDNAKWNW